MASKRQTSNEKTYKLSLRDGLKLRQSGKDQTNWRASLTVEDTQNGGVTDRTFLSKLMLTTGSFSKKREGEVRSSVNLMKIKKKATDQKRASSGNSREKKVIHKDRFKLSSIGSQPNLKKKTKKTHATVISSHSNRGETQKINMPFGRKAESVFSHHYLTSRAIGPSLRKRFESKEYGFVNKDGHASRDRIKSSKCGDSNSDVSSSISRLNISNKAIWTSGNDELPSRDSTAHRDRKMKVRISSKAYTDTDRNSRQKHATENVRDVTAVGPTSQKTNLHALFDRTKRMILSNALLKKKNAPQLETAISKELTILKKSNTERGLLKKKTKKIKKVSQVNRDKSKSRSKSAKKICRDTISHLEGSGKKLAIKRLLLDGLDKMKKKPKRSKEKRKKIKNEVELKKSSTGVHNKVLKYGSSSDNEDEPLPLPSILKASKLLNHLAQKNQTDNLQNQAALENSYSSDQYPDKQPTELKPKLIPEPLFSKTGQKQSESQEDTKHIGVGDAWIEYSGTQMNDKHTIRSQFKKFTAESEKGWNRMLRNLEQIENQRLGLMSDSFFNKVQEYKKKAQVCLRAVRAVGISSEVFSRDISGLKTSKIEPTPQNMTLIKPEKERDFTPKQSSDGNAISAIAQSQSRYVQPYLLEAIIPMSDQDDDSMRGGQQFSMPETPVRLEPDVEIRSENLSAKKKVIEKVKSIDKIVIPAKQNDNPSNCRKYIAEVWKSVDSSKPGLSSNSKLRHSAGRRGSLGLNSLSLTDLQNSSKLHSSIDKLRNKERDTVKCMEGSASALVEVHQANDNLYEDIHVIESIKPVFEVEPQIVRIYSPNQKTPSDKKEFSDSNQFEQMHKNNLSKEKVVSSFRELPPGTDLRSYFKGEDDQKSNISAKYLVSSDKSEVIDIKEWSQQYKGSPKVDPDILLKFHVPETPFEIHEFIPGKEKEEMSVVEVDVKPLIVSTNLVAGDNLEDNSNSPESDMKNNVYLSPGSEFGSTFSDHHILEPIVVDPKQFSEHDHHTTGHITEGDSILFATNEEKTDIITSFIFENLIVEAISEDHCIQKFISILGPHYRYIENKKVNDYYDCLQKLIANDKLEQSAIIKRLNIPIGQTNNQRLLLASPALTENDQESLAAFVYEPVLNISLYIRVEEVLRETSYEQRGLDQIEMEKEHIIHKMLFDTLNEDLDYRRIYGIMGVPLTFSATFKLAKKIETKEMWTILSKSRDSCTKWCQIRAGTLLENEPYLNHSNDTEEVDRMRDKSMNQLINNYVNSVSI